MTTATSLLLNTVSVSDVFGLRAAVRLFGRRAGSVQGFAYSDAMRNSGIVWSETTLDQFLTNPQAYVPGTRMTFTGLPDAQERADVIAYLKEATKVP